MRKLLLSLALFSLILGACGTPATSNPTATTPSMPLKDALLSLNDLETVNPTFASLFASEPILGEDCMIQNLDCQVLSFRSDGEPYSVLGIEVTQFEDSEGSLAGSDSYQEFLKQMMGDHFQEVETDALPVGSWFIDAGETVLLGVPYQNLFILFAVDTIVVENTQALAFSLAQAQIEKLKENGY